tara:strand:- start:107282 stop:107590 length:309 start_codon:yes stop_codon:yes gene_type:complete
MLINWALLFKIDTFLLTTIEYLPLSPQTASVGVNRKHWANPFRIAFWELDCVLRIIVRHIAVVPQHSSCGVNALLMPCPTAAGRWSSELVAIRPVIRLGGAD